MAAGGEKLFDLLAVAGRADDFLVSKDQDLKFLVAFRTVILKYRHFLSSYRGLSTICSVYGNLPKLSGGISF